MYMHTARQAFRINKSRTKIWSDNIFEPNPHPVTATDVRSKVVIMLLVQCLPFLPLCMRFSCLVLVL